MSITMPQFLFFLETLIFASVIFMFMAKKNFTVIFLYSAQSLIISLALFYSSFKILSFSLMGIAVLFFLVKAVVAPYFFFGLVKKHQTQFSASTSLNGPMTLIVLALLTAFAYSDLWAPLAILAPDSGNALPLALAVVFVSLFLIVNRRGVLSQMIGILSLENAIVSFAYITGLEATAGPQLGILFDIAVWMGIAIVFASMIYRHFGSLDVSEMQFLKEE